MKDRNEWFEEVERAYSKLKIVERPYAPPYAAVAVEAEDVLCCLGLHPHISASDWLVINLDEVSELIELINPEIIKAEGEQTGLEGCLSVPGKYGIVTRPMVVRVRAQDRYGTEFEVEDEELTARCFCHEIEHLDGHLYTEHCKVLTDEELEQYIREQEKELDEE